MIKPTVGRVVLYTPNQGSPDETLAKGTGKLAAIITNVWSDTCVNLAVFDANGIATNRTSVLLVQEGNPIPTGGFYCEWMEHQKGQAAKTEELEEKLKQHQL